jgi:membrane protein DedA with SNARE-associated domain
MPYPRFLMYSIPAAMVQPIVLLFVWYNLWNSYNLAIKYLPYPGIIVLIILVILFLMYRKVNQSIAKSFTK